MRKSAASAKGVRAHLIRNLPLVDSQALDRRNPIVGDTPQVVDQVLPRVSIRADVIGLNHLPPEVGVGVDERGHDGFAVQVDADGPGRGLQLTFPANFQDLVVLDKKGGVLDGRAAIANDEAGAFEQGRSLLRCSRRQTQRSQEKITKQAHGFSSIVPPARSAIARFPPYSHRKALIGSMPVARRAGT